MASTINAENLRQAIRDGLIDNKELSRVLGAERRWLEETSAPFLGLPSDYNSLADYEAARTRHEVDHQTHQDNVALMEQIAREMGWGTDSDPGMVQCDCGHSCPRAQVMSASLGTSCPNCYDRMSD